MIFARNMECWDSIYIRTSASDFRNDSRNPTPLIFSELRQNFQPFSYSDYRDYLSYIYITHAALCIELPLQTYSDSEQSPPIPIPPCAKSHSWADSCRPHKQRASDYVLGFFKLFSKYLTIGNGNEFVTSASSFTYFKYDKRSNRMHWCYVRC